jgi:uncharacterized membrane protein
MASSDLRGLATTAKLGSHPVHPMLIPFPIALLVTTFACDLAYWASGDNFWARGAFWALTAAIVTALVAALAGFVDFAGNARIRALSDAWQHMIGNLVAVGLAMISLLLRWSNGSAEAVLPWGLLLSALIVCLLVFTGWKGGELVYHHRIGMQPQEPRTTERP